MLTFSLHETFGGNVRLKVNERGEPSMRFRGRETSLGEMRFGET
jgi:hypothetical protein